MENNNGNIAPEAQTSRRQAFIDKMKERKPDLDFDNDDALFAAIDEDMSGLNEKIGSYESDIKKLVDLFSADPMAAVLFTKWSEGKRFPFATFISMYGDDLKAALEDPEKAKDIEDSHKEWTERVSKNRKLEEEAAKNFDETVSALEKLKKENGWTDEQAENIFDTVNKIFMDGTVNIIRPETFKLIANGLNYDDDVRNAGELGEIRGKNAKIEARLKSEKLPDDVPPALGSAGSSIGKEENRKEYYNPFVAGSRVRK